MAKARVYVSMVDNPGTLPDPTPEAEDPNDLDNPTNRPGRCAHALTFGLAGAGTCPNSSSEPNYTLLDAINVPQPPRQVRACISPCSAGAGTCPLRLPVSSAYIGAVFV